MLSAPFRGKANSCQSAFNWVSPWGLTVLRSLDISGSAVASLESLRKHRALRSLSAPGTAVTSLEPLRNSPRCSHSTSRKRRSLASNRSGRSPRYADVSGTQVPSLEPIYSFPGLHLRSAGNLTAAILKPFIEFRKTPSPAADPPRELRITGGWRLARANLDDRSRRAKEAASSVILGRVSLVTGS
jgi:hypothetical protein